MIKREIAPTNWQSLNKAVYEIDTPGINCSRELEREHKPRFVDFHT